MTGSQPQTTRGSRKVWARFALLIVVAGLGAFLAGTRLVQRPGRSTHTVTGRIIPGMATDARWMERATREQEEAPDMALAALGIAPGMTVADVGAGTGFVTVKLARLVGPTGTVYANEIQPDMLRRIADRIREQQLDNVRLIQGTEDAVGLPAESIDVALLVDVYHEFQRPQAMLQSIRRAVKPTGRLVLMEYREEDPTVPIADTHRMSITGMRAEIASEGFVFDRAIETLPRQHIVIFRRRAPE